MFGIVALLGKQITRDSFCLDVAILVKLHLGSSSTISDI